MAGLTSFRVLCGGVVSPENVASHLSLEGFVDGRYGGEVAGVHVSFWLHRFQRTRDIRTIGFFFN